MSQSPLAAAGLFRVDGMVAAITGGGTGAGCPSFPPLMKTLWPTADTPQASVS